MKDCGLRAVRATRAYQRIPEGAGALTTNPRPLINASGGGADLKHPHWRLPGKASDPQVRSSFQGPGDLP